MCYFVFFKKNVLLHCSIFGLTFYIYFVLQDYALKHSDSQSLLDSFNTKIFYFTRTRGLFRYCYPKERPPASIGKFLF